MKIEVVHGGLGHPMDEDQAWASAFVGDGWKLEAERRVLR